MLSKKKVFKNFFSNNLQNFNTLKNTAVLSRGQGNFRGLKALRPRPRTSICLLEAKDVLEDSTSAEYKPLTLSISRKTNNESSKALRYTTKHYVLLSNCRPSLLCYARYVARTEFFGGQAKNLGGQRKFLRGKLTYLDKKCMNIVKNHARLKLFRGQSKILGE